jgi:hypothetical protein
MNISEQCHVRSGPVLCLWMMCQTDERNVSMLVFKADEHKTTTPVSCSDVLNDFFGSGGELLHKQFSGTLQNNSRGFCLEYW